MQRILNKKEGCFHVHLHLWKGKPSLSRIDKIGIPPIMPSFQSSNREESHGILIFSQDDAIAYVWMKNSNKGILVDKISIIGRPMKIINEEPYVIE